MKTLVLASHNQKKRDELAAALIGHVTNVTVLTLSDVGLDAPEENGATFVDNALIKVRHCVAHTGFAAIADDSGLCVQLLNGAPGVISARYAGVDATDQTNNSKLLAELAATGVEGPYRAKFHATVVFATEEGTEHVVEAHMPGVIKTVAKGVNGFGYDPLFYADAYQHTRSNAELSLDEKQAISHRGQALRRLLPAIISWAEPPG